MELPGPSGRKNSPPKHFSGENFDPEKLLGKISGIEGGPTGTQQDKDGDWEESGKGSHGQQFVNWSLCSGHAWGARGHWSSGCGTLAPAQ